MRSQVGLRKYCHKQRQWRWWNSSWAISNPERWCCESAALNMSVNLNTQQWSQDWKRSVFIPIPKKGNAKECSNYCTIALIPHTSEVMSKFSKPGFNNIWTMKFQMFKLVLTKAEVPEIKLPTSLGSLKKQESSRKASTSALSAMPKVLTVWITTNCGKF